MPYKLRVFLEKNLSNYLLCDGSFVTEIVIPISLQASLDVAMVVSLILFIHFILQKETTTTESDNNKKPPMMTGNEKWELLKESDDDDDDDDDDDMFEDEEDDTTASFQQTKPKLPEGFKDKLAKEESEWINIRKKLQSLL